MINIAELRALAEAATPGPWVETTGEPGSIGALWKVVQITTNRKAADNASKANAAYIAAFSPATALALLERLEAAEKREKEWVDRWSAVMPDMSALLAESQNECSDLHQRVAELEAVLGVELRQLSADLSLDLDKEQP